MKTSQFIRLASFASFASLAFTVSLSASAGRAATVVDDGQIVSILTTANAAEIAAGETAAKSAATPAVKSFADEMVAAHTKNQQDGDALAKKAGIKPEAAAKQATLKADATAKMANLKTKSGKAFDVAYIDAQVDMHTTVLKEIDTELLPSAKNADLKAFLQTTRGHVAMHLESAKKLQSSLK